MRKCCLGQRKRKQFYLFIVTFESVEFADTQTYVVFVPGYLLQVLESALRRPICQDNLPGTLSNTDGHAVVY